MDQRVEKNWARNFAAVRAHLPHNDDVSIRQFEITRKQAFLVSIPGIVDKALVADGILSPLSNFQGSLNEDAILNAVTVPVVKQTEWLREAIQQVLEGNAVLFVDGISKALIIDVSAAEQRNVNEPDNEVLIRGPHIGFIENLTVNLSIVRRYLRNPMLRVENMALGTQNKATIALVFLEGTTHPQLVDEVRKRLNAIHVDAVLGCGYIEQLIEDAPNSIFPTVRHTERPDPVVASLLEGRVAIFTDGCPTALILPHLFIDHLQSPEDYHSRPQYSSLMRILRVMGLFLATQFPALYVASENFHKELVPSPLLVSVAGSREGVPFPLALEVLIMLFAFELIKESGLRMPKPIGGSISIVGGLILGQAAVDSGFVGIPTVIIVAVAGISGFLSSSLMQTVSIIRVALLLPAAFVGLYGLILADLLILLHVAALKSFGVPYLVPLVPTYFPDWKDTFIRSRIKEVNTSNPRLRHNIGRYLED